MIIAAIIILVLLVFTFSFSYYAYRKAFYSSPRRVEDYRALPSGEYHDRFREARLALIDNIAAQPFERVFITSRDGLKLVGRYYHFKDNAPLEILFHGYRSTAYHDCGGGYKLCRDAGLNLLIVDQRAHGESEGRAITFGIKERYDCLDWVNYAVGRFGKDVKIILSGISMGASTVLMASDLPLPENVVGIIADCGYSSPREIIRKVCSRKMKITAGFIYPFIRLGAIIFGGFDPNSASAVESLKKCRIPVLFIHGEDDRYVPCDMGRENYAACASQKRLFTVPGAGHGYSYLVDEQGYVKEYYDFLKSVLAPHTEE